MKILVTGSAGFIGKNLMFHLQQEQDIELSTYNSSDSPDSLGQLVGKADFIVHLAGVNRPENIEEFDRKNTGLTKILAALAKNTKKKPPILFASSVHAEAHEDSDMRSVAVYGRSKYAAEKILKQYATDTGSDVFIFRLPHIMGKWCKPDYNSVIATFCHNISRGLPITVNDRGTELNIVYIDDLVTTIIHAIKGSLPIQETYQVAPEYRITLGELADAIYRIRGSRHSLVTENVGGGFMRALYATYMSYTETKDFSYTIQNYSDARGSFVEFLKTKSAGQFSYFTSAPGVTRGKHYHHTKSEKFLILQGRASYRFRNIVTGSEYTIECSAEDLKVVETIPGWAHDITNVGDNELLVLLWASEIFDRENPDTYSKEL